MTATTTDTSVLTTASTALRIASNLASKDRSIATLSIGDHDLVISNLTKIYEIIRVSLRIEDDFIRKSPGIGNPSEVSGMLMKAYGEILQSTFEMEDSRAALTATIRDLKRQQHPSVDRTGRNFCVKTIDSALGYTLPLVHHMRFVKVDRTGHAARADCFAQCVVSLAALTRRIGKALTEAIEQTPMRNRAGDISHLLDAAVSELEAARRPLVNAREALS